MSEDRLDQALNEMRNESAPEAEFAAARDRVLAKLQAHQPAVCEEFRSELAAYAAGRLSESRRLLMDDHLSRCAECRKAYGTLQGERKVVAMPVRPVQVRWQRWAIAAGVALVALYAGRDPLDRALAPSGPRATVEVAKGGIYKVPDGALATGAAIQEGDIVRTGAGARAVLRLADGSAVELNQRTELLVRAAWSGQTIELRRGDVIVQAAKQRRGRLRVQTGDSLAQVKGTIFAVSAGMTGSLVSVVEGSVAVTQPGGERLLQRGEQAASSAALGAVSPRQAVAWSEDSEKYYALLGEFSKLEKQIAAIPAPALRTQARLVPYLPDGAWVYGAMPNLSGTLKQALLLADQRAGESETFREWWNSAAAGELKKMLEQVQSVLPMLGDEIGFVMIKDGTAGKGTPMVLAEVRAGQKEALQKALEGLWATGKPNGGFRVTDQVMVISDTSAHAESAMARMGRGSASPFAAEVANRYRRGAGWLFGMDLAAMRGVGGAEAKTALAGASLSSVFFEQRTTQGVEENEATLKFAGERKGPAAWLAPGGAGGASQYISSDAVASFAGTIVEPSQIYAEIMAMATSKNPDAEAKLKELEAKLGISVANDIAAAIGTDFAVALERPGVPVPGVVAAIEVYKPGTLDGTIAKVVDAANREPAMQGKQITLAQESAGGRLWMSLKPSTGLQTLYWTYDQGYMVLSNDRGLAERAIQTRNGGFALVRAANFQQQMPSSAGLHPSGFFWLNTKGALEGVLKQLPAGGQMDAFRKLASDRDPLLVVFSGEKERIHAASRTRLTSLVFDAMMAPMLGGGGGAKAVAARKAGIAKNANRN
ncbi:MAG: FecR domain-containing protein [Acidobacteria bacterium]|nr:FecR domain-containing protein [Acidobacteriota bacterium]